MEIFTPDHRQIAETERSRRQRIVFKLGSGTVCDESGAVRTDLLHSFARQAKDLQGKGIDPIFVRSGSVAVGRFVAPGVEDRKLATVIGQSWLDMACLQAFHPTPIASFLLTDEQIADTAFMRQTILSALDAGAVPIINSANPDTNNDWSGRQAAHAIDADVLALLTTTDGVLHQGQTVPHIRSRGDLAKVHFSGVSAFGTGGMGEKSDHAWKFVESTGREAVIAHGFTDQVLHRIANRERIGTRFAHA